MLDFFAKLFLIVELDQRDPERSEVPGHPKCVLVVRDLDRLQKHEDNEQKLLQWATEQYLAEM